MNNNAAKDLAMLAADAALDKRGKNIKVLELTKLSSVADYFVICSADSDVQVKAIADNVEDHLRENGSKVFHREGTDSLNWVILDYFDVVVHVFKNEARSFYNLEKLWGDAPVFEVKDDENTEFTGE